MVPITPGEGLETLAGFRLRDVETDRAGERTYASADAALRAKEVSPALVRAVLCGDDDTYLTGPRVRSGTCGAGILNAGLRWADLQQVYAHACRVYGVDPDDDSSTGVVRQVLRALRDRGPAWRPGRALEVVLSLSSRDTLDAFAAASDDGTGAPAMSLDEVVEYVSWGVPLSSATTYFASRRTAARSRRTWDRQAWRSAGFADVDADTWAAFGPDSFVGTSYLLSPRYDHAYLREARVPVAFGTDDYVFAARGFAEYLSCASDAEQEEFFRPPPFAPEEAATWRADGLTDPMSAADWRRYGFTSKDAAAYGWQPNVILIMRHLRDLGRLPSE